MKIKDKIQSKSIDFRKSKNLNGISAINSLKTAITEQEKVNKNVELVDEEIYKIVNKLIKQREDSKLSFLNVGNTIKANDEEEQKEYLKIFLPEQMTEDEIVEAIKGIVLSLGETPNKQAKIGKTIGTFNKQYTGRADTKKVIEIVNKILN